jgi:hypothetical protein
MVTEYLKEITILKEVIVADQDVDIVLSFQNILKVLLK